MVMEKNRAEALEDFLAGKKVSFKRNPKGDYELHSPDGDVLYTYDYKLIKKMPLSVEGQSLILVNRAPHDYLNEHGGSWTQGHDKLMRLLGNTLGGHPEILPLFLGHDKDMNVFDLTSYISRLAIDCYNISQIRVTNYGLVWFSSIFKNDWEFAPLYTIRRAIAILKHLGHDPLFSIGSTPKSLQAIVQEIKPRWLALKTVIRYFLNNNLTFKDVDNAYIVNAHRSIKMAYAALGGPTVVSDGTNPMVFMSVCNPTVTPLDVLPMYISGYDTPIIEAATARLKRGI